MGDGTGASAEMLNEATRVVRIGDVPSTRRPPEARAVFEACYPSIRKNAVSQGQPAVLICAMHAWGEVVGCAPVHADEALILGRHSRCGLRLGDETIALRQLAVLVSAGARGEPVTRLWDLATGQPFTLEDGGPSAGVVAEGLLYASVGAYGLLFVPFRPSWPDSAREGFEALPPRRFIDQRAPRTTAPPRPRPVRADGNEWETKITRVDALTLLDELETPDEGVAELTITLCRRRKSATVRISARHLEDGVLLGRYDRCGLRLDDKNISRVHVLIVKVDRDIWAIDTASTNGVGRGTELVSASRLRDPDELWITEDARVDWRLLRL